MSAQAHQAPLGRSLLRQFAATMGGAGQLRTSALDRHAAAHDASHFLLIPQAVAEPSGAAEVAALMQTSAAHQVPLTLRSGGTSLSGQAVSGGLLVDVRKNFRAIEVLDDGARVRVQPGVTVRDLNARLLRYGRKFGPDPASEAACTIGAAVHASCNRTCELGMTRATRKDYVQVLEVLAQAVTAASA